MQATRVEPNKQGKIGKLPEGGFAKCPIRGVWLVKPPKSGTHDMTDVVEHADGTITMNQEINTGRWKGRLDRGVWVGEEVQPEPSS